MWRNSRLTRWLATATLAAGLAGGGLLSAAPVGAAPMAPTSATVSIPPDYEYAGEFFFGASCDEAGQAGMNRGWSHYICDGAWNRNYDLWIKPKR